MTTKKEKCIRERILVKVAQGILDAQVAAELLGEDVESVKKGAAAVQELATQKNILTEVLAAVSSIKPNAKPFTLTLTWTGTDWTGSIRKKTGSIGARRGRIARIRYKDLVLENPYNPQLFQEFVAKALVDPNRVNRVLSRYHKWGTADALRQMQKWLPEIAIEYKE